MCRCADFRFQITDVQISDYRLQITDYRLQITDVQVSDSGLQNHFAELMRPHAPYRYSMLSSEIFIGKNEIIKTQNTV